MTGGWSPWRRLLPVWLPTVVLCVANLALYGWQTSQSVGRGALLQVGLDELETELVKLRRMEHDAAADRAKVDSLKAELKRLDEEVFGRLDERLTDILRAVNITVQVEAGLVPGHYSYSWSEEKTLGLVRFEVQFSVIGEYPQVRRMVAALQASPEFLIVDSLTLAGEAEAVTKQLRVAVRVATYLTEADPQRLKEIGAERRSRTRDQGAASQTEAETALPAAGTGRAQGTGGSDDLE